ncbi:uncharacterized protein BO88DRAFT_466646 [Aspergillus vadensis CBS 113365]|uniref:Uncharacterized protein n=1 Tax=Aspergillus vadensis (strain CBS 113365 / IMI 142717 / IBT 24658) TaxID=1448311 RepID=A0A319B9N9_ASPVC|nr:hypothetical protein BO88DRAFT_466646 [Aspergillus vadensis CBS 113365]PYH67170.1 hypothetical protein BO88DRAFT_466646 [Aspergillus vadensis CBS 113365]
MNHHHHHHCSAPSPSNVAGEGSEIFNRAQTQNERISADQIPASGERHKTTPPPDLQDAIAARTSNPQETGPWPAQDSAQSHLDQHPHSFRASFRRSKPSSDAGDEATGPYTRRPSAEPQSTQGPKLTVQSPAKCAHRRGFEAHWVRKGPRDHSGKSMPHAAVEAV